jgi:hypothetical protein
LGAYNIDRAAWCGRGDGRRRGSGSRGLSHRAHGCVELDDFRCDGAETRRAVCDCGCA